MLEINKRIEEMIKNNTLKIEEVAFKHDSYADESDYIAVVGFKDQRDAKSFSEITGGDFSVFYKERGWQSLFYRDSAKLTNIFELFNNKKYTIVQFNGDEDYPDLCMKIIGVDIFKHIYNYLDDLLLHRLSEYDIDEKVIKEWIITDIKLYKENKLPRSFSTKREEIDYLHEEFTKRVGDALDFLNNFRGYKGYIVIDDINWIVEEVYDTEYPASCREDNGYYIFGVLYPVHKRQEIEKIIYNK